ncbi:hypothetical protein [Halogeometricum luteum]|uniref:Uncharacterized protein n=1 Tax=Halogeometricum luteum TaxID=2950537 RepID=A0ABU2FY04_9EURY|nr:hypothetical protein [Halogeometricum sp. S3BR5-2]MDS0292808.1 hypothetical protein [Halogeometricum sp. S3BR5-2]
MSDQSCDRFRTRLSLLVVATVVFSVVGGGVTYGALADEERAVVSVGVGTFEPTAVAGDGGETESESARNGTNASGASATSERSTETGTETATERKTATDAPAEEASATPTPEPTTATDATATPEPTGAEPTGTVPTEGGE